MTITVTFDEIEGAVQPEYVQIYSRPLTTGLYEVEQDGVIVQSESMDQTSAGLGGSIQALPAAQ